MSAAAASSRVPFGQIAAVYLLSVPLAWLVASVGVSWDAAVGGLAAALAWLIGLDIWWVAINAAFVPALSFALSLDVSPLWGLAAFVALMLVYGGIWKSRVPLFFTSTRSQAALDRLLPAGRFEFLDLGCGDARVLTRLAAGHPEARFEGVEQALAPWLMALLRCRMTQGRCAVRRADLWNVDLGAYDVVYAYLSPAAMPGLWAKAQREMRPGSRLISAFAVPGVAPDEAVDVDDAVRTTLRVWRMGGNAR
jgi:hypothetical protein